MRIDQELSCDAAVIEQRPKARRAYAETLLKTQLTSRPLPVGCYWPASANASASAHPLTERIDMLTRRPVSQRRRIAATIAILLFACTAGAAAWAAQPTRKIQSTIETPPIVAGEAPEVLLPLQPFGPHRADVKASPDDPAPPSDLPGVSRPKLRADGQPPDYPKEAFDAHAEGMVTLELCVSKTGTVESAKVKTSSGFALLDDAALGWVAKSLFDPATRNGKPIAVCNYPLAYDWRLEQTDKSPS
jgi:TonB family protein